LLATAELLTQSRGGEIAIVAALVFIVAVGIFRLRIFLGLLAVAALGGIEAILAGLIPVYIFNPLLARLGLIGFSLMYPNNQTFSTAERLAHWIAGLHMFFDHPLLGVGIGNYPDAYPHYFVTIFTDPLGHAHNYYINIAAETGSIGLIAYLLFLLAIFFAGAHSYRLITRKYKQAKSQAQVLQTRVRATRPPGIGDTIACSHLRRSPDLVCGVENALRAFSTPHTKSFARRGRASTRRERVKALRFSSNK
jgi:O-antigen ligase